MWNMWDNSGSWGASEKPYHAPDAKKVHVTGLDPTTSEESITDLFAQHGKIAKVDFKKHKETGQCLKFCFVTYADKESARACLTNNHANVLNGNTLQTKSCGPNGDIDGGAKSEDSKIVFVGGLPKPAEGEKDIEEEDLNTYFTQFGTVLKVDLKKTPEGRPKGYAFITFDSVETAEQCIAFSDSNGHTLSGSKIEVKTAQKGVGKHSSSKGKGKGKGNQGYANMANMWNQMDMMGGGMMGGWGGMGMMNPMMMGMGGWGMGGMGGMSWGGMGNGSGKGKGKGRSAPY